MQLVMPSNVSRIIQKLQDEGFEAYAVGGCVRDSYLGLSPHDWDITTNALPLQVKSLFRRTIDVGIKHGTVKIMIGDEGYEVTTYRIDGEYEDSRHPKEVTFTSELREDLRRRDFTINAMAYSERTGLVDLFDGIGDLERGIIRAVGNAEERFTEDALRILRALRFSARFDYEIEGETLEAIRKLAPNLSKISAERIREELEKLILSDYPERLMLAYELGVTAVIFPEWDEMVKCQQNSPYHIDNVAVHSLKAMKYVDKLYPELDDKDRRIVMLATMLHDIGKPSAKTTDEEGVDHFKKHPQMGVSLAEGFLKRLKYDNDTIHKVIPLVRYHDERPVLTLPNVRRLMVKVGVDNVESLIILKRVDMLAHSDYKYDERLSQVSGLEDKISEIIANKDPLSIKELKVCGKDLISAGFKPGPQMGDMLQEMLELVLNDPSKNSYDELMKLVWSNYYI